MDRAQILKYIEDNNIYRLKFGFADIDGVLRGKVIHKKKFKDALTDGIRFCDVVFGWDSQDALYKEGSVTGWHSGFPDKTCFIDLATFRLIPWEQDIPFFLADFSKSVEVCPRSLLKRVAGDCLSMGYNTLYAQEFEWYNFQETAQSIQEKDFRQLNSLSSGMFGYSLLRPSQHSAYYYDLFDHLGRFKVPLEGLHTETGPGVYEAAIINAPVLEAADRAVLLKSGVKDIASRHSVTASFMAKWNSGLPGCSGHIHQSLWSEGYSRNLFFDDTASDNMSDLMKHFIAGQLYCLPHIMPMYAPTINSYKRLVDGAWAPTTVSWGIENRTTAVRVLNSAEKYTRSEMRVPGADANPYLSIAASLASGLYGIKHRLDLQEITRGDAYQQVGLQKLPKNLGAAVNNMSSSVIAKELFGDIFVLHFTQSRMWEWEQYNKQVSDWELRRYFEII